MYERLRLATKDMVSPLELHGLRGRKLVHPPRGTAKRTIVFIYGIHGSLERFYGVIHFLARFGTVIVPDLPGFGGMEPWRKVGVRPSLDAYGDYLAEFLETQVDAPRVTLIGLSYGFVALTRMLVRHPKLGQRVELIISLMGLAAGSDLSMKPAKRQGARALLTLARAPITNRIFTACVGSKLVLSLIYLGHPKMKALSAARRKEFIEFESILWTINDMRTWGTCIDELFTFTQTGDHVDLTLHHVETKKDHWLAVSSTVAHLEAIYTKVVVHDAKVANHGGVAYEEEAEAAAIISPEMSALLGAQS